MKTRLTCSDCKYFKSSENGTNGKCTCKDFISWRDLYPAADATACNRFAPKKHVTFVEQESTRMFEIILRELSVAHADIEEALKSFKDGELRIASDRVRVTLRDLSHTLTLLSELKGMERVEKKYRK